MGDTFVEIERKFLLSGMPPIPGDVDSVRYAHGYLPGEVIKERLTHRSKPPIHERTVKIGTGLVRHEFREVITDEDFFVKLWNLTHGRRVYAQRWKVPLSHEHMNRHFPFWSCDDMSPLVWEITQFQDRALVMAEIEFPSDTWCNSDSIELDRLCPDWLRPYIVKEVTGDVAYEGFNMCR